MERNDLSESDAERRISAQMSLDQKCKMATYVIDNSSSRERTGEQVKRLYEKFSGSYAYLTVRLLVLLFVAVTVGLGLYIVAYMK